MRNVAGCGALLVLLVLVCGGAAVAQQVEVDPQQRVSDVEIEGEGDAAVVVVQTPRGEQRLTPQQYLAAIRATQEHQRAQGFLFVLFNITSWTGVFWVSFGLLAQLVFAGRLMVQWIASEKSKRSVVPTIYWWLSIVGATMLVAYFCWRKDIVGILGQSTGWFIYVRNLWLIYKHAPPEEPLLGSDVPAS